VNNEEVVVQPLEQLEFGFLPQRKHGILGSVGQWCLKKITLFILRTKRNPRMQSFGKIPNYRILKAGGAHICQHAIKN
jgi:hypothetical protein